MVPKSATLHILITDNGSIAIIIKVLFLGDLAQPGYCGEEGSWNKCQRLSAASQGGGFFTGENAMWHQAVRITVAVTPTWQYWILNYPFCCTHCRRNSQCFSVGQTIPMGDFNPNQYMVPWADMSQPPNGISIGSAVFAQHIRVTNTQTHRPHYVQHIR